MAKLLIQLFTIWEVIASSGTSDIISEGEAQI